MFSFSALQTHWSNLCNDGSSAAQTLGLTLYNDAYKVLCAEKDWDFLQKSFTASTVASQQFYALPFDYDEIIDVTVTVGTTQYLPKEAPSRQKWDELNETTSFKSNFPEWFYIFNQQIGFWPTPSSSTTNAISINYRRRVIDLSISDVTAGTVDSTSTVSGTTTINGSGTSWNASMIGQFIRVTPSTAVASNGDGFWYEIATVPSATSLTTVRTYGGAALSAGAGASYTIGQLPILPEAYQLLPMYKALQPYFGSINPDVERYKAYVDLYESLHANMLADHGAKSTNVLIETVGYESVINPNLTISF